MKLNRVIWTIQMVLIVSFLAFSYLPFCSTLILILSEFFYSNLTFITLSIGLTLFLGGLTIYGLITLHLGIRNIGTLVFSIGIIFNFNNAYLLSIGVILSWLFYEIWYLCNQYHQMETEYRTYSEESTEKQKLLETFRSQISSLGLLSWIALSVSLIILMITTNFYIELGFNFGTLGVSISFAVIFFIYLTKKFTTVGNLIQ
ncbi:MAG: hypothetical protein ACXACK_10395 [Candidatus Hodarchaeales archaeon]|jgi:hypothetical protein